jgi:hypothetical protein
VSRFDEAHEEARRLELARAISARAKVGEHERVLCGVRDCREDLPRLKGAREVAGVLLVGFLLDGWRESAGIWRRDRGHRTRGQRSRPGGTTELERARRMAVFARQVAGHQHSLVGRTELTLPAYFECPRCGRLNVVPSVRMSG